MYITGVYIYEFRNVKIFWKLFLLTIKLHITFLYHLYTYKYYMHIDKYEILRQNTKKMKNEIYIKDYLME